MQARGTRRGKRKREGLRFGMASRGKVPKKVTGGGSIVGAFQRAEKHISGADPEMDQALALTSAEHQAGVAARAKFEAVSFLCLVYNLSDAEHIRSNSPFHRTSRPEMITRIGACRAEGSVTARVLYLPSARSFQLPPFLRFAHCVWVY